MARTAEGGVKKEIEDWLTYQGFLKMGAVPDTMSNSARFLGTYYKPVPHPFQVAGIADFVLCVLPDGHTLWIEAKEPKRGKVSGPQEMRHHEIKVSGGTVWVVNSLDSLICQAVESNLFEVIPYHRDRRP